MNYEMTGTLYEVFDTVQRTATFKIREFIVEHSKDINGKAIVNYIKFQTTQDKTDLIDKFKPGDKVRVHFNVRGTKYERNGQVSYFNNLDAWRIEQVLSTQQEGVDAEPPESVDSSGFDNSGDDLPF